MKSIDNKRDFLDFLFTQKNWATAMEEWRVIAQKSSQLYQYYEMMNNMMKPINT